MQPVSASFEFLRSHGKQLYRFAAQAEHYFRTDPNTTLMKLRQFAELLAKEVAARTGSLRSADDRFVDILGELGRSATLERRIERSMQAQYRKPTPPKLQRCVQFSFVVGASEADHSQSGRCVSFLFEFFPKGYNRLTARFERYLGDGRLHFLDEARLGPFQIEDGVQATAHALEHDPITVTPAGWALTQRTVEADLATMRTFNLHDLEEVKAMHPRLALH